MNNSKKAGFLEQLQRYIKNVASLLCPAFWNKFILVFLPSISVLGLVFMSIYLSEEKSQKIITRSAQASHIAKQDVLIKKRIRSIISDLLVLASHHEMLLILNNEKKGNWRALEHELLEFCRYKGIYDQVRGWKSYASTTIAVTL